MSTINQQLEQGQREYGVNSSSFYKFERGDNRIRILTEGQVIATHFFGKGVKASTCYGVDKGCPFHGNNAPKNKDGREIKPSIKYTCYVLDKKENRIQLADLPFSVIKGVGELQTNEDYRFDSFPMPYDITVKYDPDSDSPNNMYKVIPSPKREEVSQDTLDELLELTTKQSPAEHVQKKKEWQMQEHDKDGIRLKVGLTKEQIAEANRIGAQHAEDRVEYPEENIHPDDIPF